MKLDYKEIIKNGKIEEFEDGESGLTQLIIHNGKKYVLRKFLTKKETEFRFKVYTKLKKYKFLPKIYYKDNNKMLFEFIPGNTCKKPPENLKIVRNVAKICAFVNKTKFSQKTNPDKKFLGSLDILLKKRRISKAQRGMLKKFYLDKKKLLSPKIVLELWDTHQGNFIERDGNLYFIDLGGISVDYQGLGIPKVFSWFRTKRQRNHFIESYNTFTSSKLLTPEYKDFIFFYYRIISVAERQRRGKNWDEISKSRLNKALKLTKQSSEKLYK